MASDFGIGGAEMIVYTKLWETMQNRNMSAYKLTQYHGFSTHTISRLRHNAGISIKLIDDLCRLLSCRVEDIMEYLPDEE